MKIEFDLPDKHIPFLTELAEKYTNGEVNKFVKREFSKVIGSLKDAAKSGMV